MPPKFEYEDELEDGIFLTEDEVDDDIFDDLYGDIVGVGDKHVWHRLQGARLAAGYVVVSDVARLLGLPEATYRHAEQGRRAANQELVDKAAALFEVSPNFLLEGEVTSEQDQLAERLSQILRRNFDGIEMEDAYEDLLERLREMREAAGYDNPSAASEAFGWSRSGYFQHEVGYRTFSMDRLAAYALAMGARPEWAVLGTGQREELIPTHWKEQKRLPPEEEQPIGPAMGR